MQASAPMKCESCRTREQELFLYDYAIHQPMMTRQQRYDYLKQFDNRDAWLCPNCYSFHSRVEAESSMSVTSWRRA